MENLSRWKTIGKRGRALGVRSSFDFSQVTLSKSHNPPFLASVSSCVKWRKYNQRFRVIRIK